MTLLGKTLAERALEACAGLPLRSRIANAHHLAGQVENLAREHQLDHVQMEPVLLDSGGALAKAVAGRRLQAEHVLAHNGDVLHDFDLGALWEGHLEAGNDITLAMVDVPSVNTVLVEEGCFAGVLGHPSCPTETAGARRLTFSGIAFYRTELFKGWSTRAWTVKDLWHKAAFEQGRRVACVELPKERLWEDCGRAEDLLHAAHRLLAREGKTGRVSPQARVSVDAAIGEDAVIEADVWIEAGASVRNCLLLPGARVAAHEELSDLVRNPGGDARW
jgi:NDP-sugar pyrophosphorylase family protein